MSERGLVPSHNERSRPVNLLGLLEPVASTAAAGLVLLLPLHALGVYFCLGADCGEPTPGDVLTYRVLVAVLAAVVATTLALAVRRGGRRALVWHAPVALAGVASAVLFAVPQVDWQDLGEREPEPAHPEYVPCYSGGTSDCPGG